MDALVNYNTDDEQDTIDLTKAEREHRDRSPGRGRHSYGMESRTRKESSGGRRGTPTTRNSNSRDGASPKHVRSTPYGSNDRSDTSSHYSRDSNRDGRNSRVNREIRDNTRDRRDNVRDHRSDREPRDARHTKDHSRNDYKSDRKRSRDNCDSDNFDSRRHRDGGRHRASPSAAQKNNRYSGNERDERYETASSNPTSSTAFRQPHHNRTSHDSRHSDQKERAPDHSSSRHRHRRSKSRSPSPSPHPRHQKHRSTHDDKSRSRHRSRSRSRSRSLSPKRSDSCDRGRGRESHALDQARKAANETERKIPVDEDYGKKNDEAQTSSQSVGVRGRPEALLALPLSDTAPKQPNVIAVAPIATSSNNGEPAVIQLPTYYNPHVINPNKYAEQVQKRKLLWGAKKVEDTAKKWGNAQFSQDTDGKVASKFMRLMGIKGAVPPKGTDGNQEEKSTAAPSVAPDVKTREVMFSNMEQQYEVARQVTHTMRGVGLGFSSQARPF